MRRTFDNLTVRVVILVLLAVLPSLGMIIFTAFEQRRQSQADTETDLIQRVRGIAAHRDALISEVSALLTAMAEIPFVREADPSRCADFFDGLLRRFPGCTSFRIIGVDGRVRFSTLPHPEGANISDRPWFRAVVSTRAFVVGEYQVGHYTGRPSLPVAYPIQDKTGRVESILYTALDIAQLNRSNASEPLYPGEVIGFLDRNGTLLARTPSLPEDRRRDASQTEIVRIVRSRGEGTAISVGIDGIQRMFAFTALGPNRPYGYVYSGIPVDRVFGDANRLLMINLIMLGAASLLAFGAAFAFGRVLIVYPVNALLNTTERLAKGDFTARTGRSGDSGEFGRLAQAFDEMAEALRLHREGLEDLVHTRTAQLEAANEELRSFSYSVSHDLRTPLRIVEGFSSRLLKKYEPLLDEKGQDCLFRIMSGCRRMSDIIDDLLSLSRVTRTEIKAEDVDVTALVREIAEELQRSDPNRRVEFHIHNGLAACGDHGLIRAALENLLGNAWKFTGKQPSAQITVGRRDLRGGSVLFVEDNGAGFDAACSDRLFSPFERLHPSEEFPGTGIGLAIVKRIVQRHGGRIWAEGEVGKGAVFYFTLSPEEER
jgi:signal transduction histidine kinase